MVPAFCVGSLLRCVTHSPRFKVPAVDIRGIGTRYRSRPHDEVRVATVFQVEGSSASRAQSRSKQCGCARSRPARYASRRSRSTMTRRSLSRENDFRVVREVDVDRPNSRSGSRDSGGASCLRPTRPEHHLECRPCVPVWRHALISSRTPLAVHPQMPHSRAS
jgi:hypothetical protein